MLAAAKLVAVALAVAVAANLVVVVVAAVASKGRRPVVDRVMVVAQGKQELAVAIPQRAGDEEAEAGPR